MDVQVLEGSFVEVPTPEVTGMERRAFGEFVGPGGELASYAFGWTTGSEPHAARMSIGSGAGSTGSWSGNDVLDLAPGHTASRTHAGAPWTRHEGYPA